LLEGGEVMLRRQIDKVFMLAEILENEGSDQEAIELYESALTVNSTNLKYQMRLAKLLGIHGSLPEAVTKAKIVYELAEEDTLISEAEDLLKELNQFSESMESNNQLDINTKIIILPLGNPNLLILRELKDKLEDRMGIRACSQLN